MAPFVKETSENITQNNVNTDSEYCVYCISKQDRQSPTSEPLNLPGYSLSDTILTVIEKVKIPERAYIRVAGTQCPNELRVHDMGR